MLVCPEETARANDNVANPAGSNPPGVVWHICIPPGEETVFVGNRLLVWPVKKPQQYLADRSFAHRMSVDARPETPSVLPLDVRVHYFCLCDNRTFS